MKAWIHKGQNQTATDTENSGDILICGVPKREQDLKCAPLSFC